MSRPRVFMDFSVDGQPLGRVIFELFSDTAPKTCENFRALCTGEKGVSSSGVPLYYKSSILHRCIKDFMIQGGDFTKRNGTGGESIYGGMFPDEDLTRPLDSEALLCMANRGPDTNGSQFFITLRECPHLNGKHVVFGKVIRGYDDVVKKIVDVPVDAKDRPTTPVTITSCGELELRKKQPSKRDRSISEENENEDRRRRSHHRSPSTDSEPSRRRRKTSKRKKRSEDTKKDETPLQETEEEYDARLEREENERIAEQRRKELERIKRQREAELEPKDGVRFKGRGRMKFIDPESTYR
ncbi:cyclophilin-like domain-containing protein [Desarmillaria tabescens]|uniref:Peptidyl-prolyl cis-trans isomerase n=1 Tax=Armillaria tabescens TaxID=1929756 RepID=A0AA39U8X3_ARMTA|nr:cyclophilin-like domain-containing protein [Desarmillaria tabescens]KAK0469950.1 cyclophilin-like domain-containing protein [Desarmillaria tabescens]